MSCWALSRQVPSSPQVLGIGDSFEHDILGAARAGMDSLFIAGGIHAEHALLGGQVSADALLRLSAQHGVAPTYACSFFQW